MTDHAEATAFEQQNNVMTENNANIDCLLCCFRPYRLYLERKIQLNQRAAVLRSIPGAYRLYHERTIQRNRIAVVLQDIPRAAVLHSIPAAYLRFLEQKQRKQRAAVQIKREILIGACKDKITESFDKEKISKEYQKVFHQVAKKAFQHTLSEDCDSNNAEDFIRCIQKLGSGHQKRVWEFTGFLPKVQKETKRSMIYGKLEDHPKTPGFRCSARRKENDPKAKWGVWKQDERTHYSLFQEENKKPNQSFQHSGTCAYHTALTARKYWEQVTTGKKSEMEVTLMDIFGVLSPIEVFDRTHNNRGHHPRDLLQRITKDVSLTRLAINEKFDPQDFFCRLKKSRVTVLRIYRLQEIKMAENQFTFDDDCEVDQHNLWQVMQCYWLECI